MPNQKKVVARYSKLMYNNGPLNVCLNLNVIN